MYWIDETNDWLTEVNETEIKAINEGELTREVMSERRPMKWMEYWKEEGNECNEVPDEWKQYGMKQGAFN